MISLSEVYGAFEQVRRAHITARTRARHEQSVAMLVTAIREAVKAKHTDWAEMAKLLLDDPRIVIFFSWEDHA